MVKPHHKIFNTHVLETFVSAGTLGRRMRPWEEWVQGGGGAKDVDGQHDGHQSPSSSGKEANCLPSPVSSPQQIQYVNSILEFSMLEGQDLAIQKPINNSSLRKSDDLLSSPP